MIKVKYLVILDTQPNALEVDQIAGMMEKGGEIMQSWTTHGAVHHLIKYEDSSS